MANRVPVCSRSLLLNVFLIPQSSMHPTHTQRGTDGGSVLEGICRIWPFSKLAGEAEDGRERPVGRASSSVCCGHCQLPAQPCLWWGSVTHVQLPSQWCSGCRGTAMDLHTQAGQGCSCSILSSIHYENGIYGSWVSLHFHIFLCRRTSFPLSCYITLG